MDYSSHFLLIKDAVLTYLDDQKNLSHSNNRNSVPVTNTPTSHINNPVENSSGGGFFGMMSSILKFGGNIFGNNERNFTNIYSNNNNNSQDTRSNRTTSINYTNINDLKNENSSQISKLFDFIPSKEINFKNVRIILN